MNEVMAMRWQCPTCKSEVMIIKSVVVWTPRTKDGVPIDPFVLLEYPDDVELQSQVHSGYWRPTGQFIIACDRHHTYTPEKRQHITIDWSAIPSASIEDVVE